MKVPEFLNSPAKWNAVVKSIDTPRKFDEVALKILDCDDIDVYEFQDIIVKLSEDVKIHSPQYGEIIALLSDTVVELLDFLAIKAEERFTTVMKKMSEIEQKLLSQGDFEFVDI